MAASPLITAWAGLRPSHFELARERPETGPPEVALDRSPAGTGDSLVGPVPGPVPGLVPGPVAGPALADYK